MPGYGQFYDDEIQGHSLSQGHCKDSVGTSASIRLLLLSSISICGTVVKKCEGKFSCVCFD